MGYLKYLQNRINYAFDLVSLNLQTESELECFFATSNHPSDPPLSSSTKREPLPSVDMDQYGKILGKKIKFERIRNGLTQQTLAARTGIKRPNIARLERGEGLPNLGTLIKISQGLNIAIDALLRI